MMTRSGSGHTRDYRGGWEEKLVGQEKFKEPEV